MTEIYLHFTMRVFTYGDARLRVGVFEVGDQLLQVLDGVDVVVRRRGDEPDAGRCLPALRDIADHLVARQLAPLPGLRALRHLDLQLVGVREVDGGHAEAAGGDLLDRGAGLVARAVRGQEQAVCV